jgi:hypothetical protein
LTAQAFDHDYWQYTVPKVWTERRPHWHCYLWQGDGVSWGRDCDRRSTLTDITPLVVRDWLNKPAWTIKQAPEDPEAAVAWLKREYDKVTQSIGQQATAIPEKTRFGIALYDLRAGNDLSWGFWVGTSTMWSAAVVGTDAKCH